MGYRADVAGNGLEATRKICALAADAMQGYRELCLEAGMDDCLSQPIRVEELVGPLERA